MTADPDRATIVQGGRRKAYRPLPEAERHHALAEALAAYDRGDFFEAHELLEPAWMGAADLPERELYQGLIKLAAAFVHDVRGNPAGTLKNLRGARGRLVAAQDEGFDVGLDLAALLADVDERIGILERVPASVVSPPTLRRRR